LEATVAADSAAATAGAKAATADGAAVVAADAVNRVGRTENRQR
jgi:hypothetical protein